MSETQLTDVSGLWKNSALSRLDRVRAHRAEFGSGLKQAIDAIDEEAGRQRLVALASLEGSRTVSPSREGGVREAEAMPIGTKTSPSPRLEDGELERLKGWLAALEHGGCADWSMYDPTADVRALLDRIEQLSAQAYEAFCVGIDWQQATKASESQVATLTSERNALLKALEPFSDLGPVFADPDDEYDECEFTAARVDCVRAREVYRTLSRSPAKGAE